MSDLASHKVLARTSPHLPLSWYFDPKVAEVEKKLLFDAVNAGTFPFYCTEFCSALHLEMMGYFLVEP